MDPVSSKLPTSLPAGSEQLCNVLRGSQFFGDFPENEIVLLAKYVQTQVMDKDTMVFREGDPALVALFGMMRAAFNMQRVVAHQRNRDKQENIPPLVSPKQILEFATINGARVANLDHRIGSLTPGKDADLLLLKADRLDVWPVNNAYAAVVNQMNTAHVETIFVAGKPKKWRGVLTGVDHGRIMDMAQRARDAVVSRAGFEANIVA